MRIVYIILAHKLPDQLVRMVHKLNSDSSQFLIHVDRKTEDQTYQRIRESLQSCTNVNFLRRGAVYWGNASVLNTSLRAIREICTTRLEYDHVILLTGQDYPIKSNREIQQKLEETQGQSFMEHFALPDARWKHENGGLDRLMYWHFSWSGRPHALRPPRRLTKAAASLLGPSPSRRLSLQRRLPVHLKLFGGSAVWCLSRSCVEYLNVFAERDPDFLRFCQNAILPEEIYYQTVLLNSPLQGSVVNDDLHHIVWPTTDLASHHPIILGSRDFDELMGSDKLFARKFDMTIDARILDQIDQATC